MEPNKFEKHIKNSLKEREIKPSAEAWDKIAAQLDAPEKKKKNNYFRYGIAAGFIGLLMISALYFRSGEDTTDKNIKIVDTPKKVEKMGDKGSDAIQKEIEENYVESGTNNEKVAEKQVAETPENFEIKETGVAAVLGNDAAKPENEIAEQHPEKIIDTKIAEVVAQVNLLEQNNEAITEAEVDSLLRKAQQEILTDKLFQKNGKVDAMALLTEVEDELDQSFRDQIFEKLKSGFIRVRTAVADRNN